MPRATVGKLEIEYDTFGDPSSPPMLLVMGLAYQMIEWDDEVCQQLADDGFWVIRYDNRDVGLSTKLDDLGSPDLHAALMSTAPPPYTLDDMADDAVRLLDALGVEAAHVVGVSMGGMIAQLIAINHPRRVLSLTSIMSTVGGPNVVQAGAEVTAALVVAPGSSREERIEQSFETRRLINGAGVPFDEERSRRKAERAVDRSFHPEGIVRQLAAILAAPDRSPGLSRLTMPVLVIHGEEDPLVPPDNGRQAAAAVPAARLMMIPGMGHAMPERVWPDIRRAIVDNAHAARA
jgi:pimeloyl-ACP methyl ester carboxylesterase